MGRIIKLEVGDKTYTLEFNRRTLLLATDFQNEIKKEDSIATTFEKVCKFIRVAFLKNHPDITQAEVNSIIDAIDDLDGFMNALLQIIEGSIKTIEETKGNAHWEVN